MERATLHIDSVQSNEVHRGFQHGWAHFPDSAAPMFGKDHSGCPDIWSLHMEASSGEDNESQKELNTGKISEPQEQIETQREEV